MSLQLFVSFVCVYSVGTHGLHFVHGFDRGSEHTLSFHIAQFIHHSLVSNKRYLSNTFLHAPRTSLAGLQQETYERVALTLRVVCATFQLHVPHFHLAILHISIFLITRWSLTRNLCVIRNFVQTCRHIHLLVSNTRPMSESRRVSERISVASRLLNLHVG